MLRNVLHHRNYINEEEKEEEGKKEGDE